MINSSQQIENGQEESPPPALEHDTQASLRRRISRSESHRIFVTPSTLPASSRRSRRTRITVNHDINSPIVMDLPLVEAVLPTTNSNRTFPTRRSNRIANNRAPETDLDNSSIQHTSPSSLIRTRRVRNSTRRKLNFQQHTEHVAEEESQQYITHPSNRETAHDNTRMTTGERSTNRMLDPAYGFNHTRICICDQIRGDGIIIECDSCEKEFHSLVVSATTQKFEKEEDENIVLCICFFKIILSYSRLFIYSFTFFKSLGGPNA